MHDFAHSCCYNSAMANIECPHCKKLFDANNRASVVSRGAAAATGALGGGATGARIGAGIGLATGGTGMVATVPFAVVGGLIGGLAGYVLANDSRRCLHCQRVFRA